ncbi:hypothetical protein LDENG_00004570, partial [Lucifuga dentata]
TAYCCFIHNGSLQSFESLKTNYGLDSQDIFQYLQMRHWVNEIIKEGLEKADNDILNVFISAYKSESRYKIVSRLYKGFQESSKMNTQHIKNKWEREGRIVISGEEWENICKSQWKTTSSHTWREFGWKNTIRVFITPAQKKHLGLGMNCWRLCGSAVANHYHLFWECPKLLSYWREIHRCLETVFGTIIPFDALTLYMGVTTQNIQTKADKYLMRIRLTGGKKALTRKWLQ